MTQKLFAKTDLKYAQLKLVIVVR